MMAHINININAVNRTWTSESVVRFILFQLKCDDCGNTGHVHTNQICPLYQPAAHISPAQVTMMAEEEEDRIRHKSAKKVDRTRAWFVEEFFRTKKARMDFLELKKEGFAGTVMYHRRLKDLHEFTNEQQIYALIKFSLYLENIVLEMRDVQGSYPFRRPVKASNEAYYNVIKRPIDLLTMQKNVYQGYYTCREEFLQDVQQMVENSHFHMIGGTNVLHLVAEEMKAICERRFAENKEKLMHLENKINPLNANSDQKAFSFLLKTVVIEDVKTLRASLCFHNILKSSLKNPMDLNTIIMKTDTDKYHSREDFLADFELIIENSKLVSIPNSEYTRNAMVVYEACKDALEKYEERMSELEIAIKTALDAFKMNFAAAEGSSSHDENLFIEEELTDEEEMFEKAEKSMDGDHAMYSVIDEGNSDTDHDFPDVDSSFFVKDFPEGDENNFLAKDVQITSENSGCQKMSDSVGIPYTSAAMCQQDNIPQTDCDENQPCSVPVYAENENSRVFDENYDSHSVVDILEKGLYEVEVEEINSGDVMNDSRFSDPEKEQAHEKW